MRAKHLICLVSAFVFLIFSACGAENVVPLQAAETALQEVESVHSDMELEIAYSTSSGEEGEIYYLFASDTVGDVSHGELSLEALGIALGIEYYSEGANMYYSLGDAWSSAELDSSVSTIALLEDYVTMAEGFGEGVEDTVNGAGAYRYEGVVSASDFNLDSIVGEVSGIDSSSATVRLTLWLDKESYLPCSVELEVTGASSEDGEYDSASVVITMSFSNYNAVQAIEIPAEAKAAA